MDKAGHADRGLGLEMTSLMGKEVMIETGIMG